MENILDLTAARSLHNSGSSQNCLSGQYEFNGICCDFCKPGSVAKSSDCTRNPKTNCKPCTEGKDYMDKDNYITTCLRCNYCDAEHGMETEKNCTITQNVKCRCRIGFFCNSTKPCRHCEKCDQCENGIVAKDCTPTQNTVCGKKDSAKGTWLIVKRVTVKPASSSEDFVYRVRGAEFKGGQTFQIKTMNHIYDKKLHHLGAKDINWKPYIPEIVHEMEVNQVRKLVRKLGICTAQIDEISYDNLHDSAEQKIKLLERWHETHGIKGSLQTLITGLKELKFYDAVNKINQLIERKLSHPED
ncbi:Tumor necrosis factor receptor superfamily member 6, partial [Ophiophagus hannah]